MRIYKTGSKYAFWRWKIISFNKVPYLTRLILFQCPWFSVYLHWIDTPDRQRHLHDHPVNFLSLIVKGWYAEEVDEGGVVPTPYLRKWVNWIPCSKRHRIFHVSEGGAITLCFAGRRLREWGFYTPEGFYPWTIYDKYYPSMASD